jgi:lipopolysaccharide/colanic/teichoic acid biosynthesis glycosyltransferase
MQLYRNFFKRLFDFIVSLIAFSLLLPLFILVTALLFIANQGSPFFVQPRPGKNGRIFKLVKFKTMNDKKDAAGNLLSDAERLTAVGKFIRKTSLDEIPQLLNVIKGEMSLIGPRPLLVEYLPLYNDTQKRRHNVRPGITGWAQVNGRNAIGWKEKFELDVWYVDHVNFQLDCKIALLTIMKVVRSEGVSQQGHVTMSRFQGN